MTAAPINARQSRTATSLRFNNPSRSPMKVVRKLYYATVFCESRLPQDVISGSNWSRYLRLGTAVVTLASCGPPLSEPAAISVTGRWQSSNQIGALSSIGLDLTQSADGTVTGHWSANVFPPNPPCPPDLGLSPTGGTISGTHTVLELRIALLGAVGFEGQAADDRSLKGSFDSCGVLYSISFVRVSALPSG